MNVSSSLNFPLQLLYGDPPDGEESSKEIVGGDIPGGTVRKCCYGNKAFNEAYTCTACVLILAKIGENWGLVIINAIMN